MKDFAPSCERNKDPILVVLREILTEPGLVMEIGSGTGQHAAYFAQHLPHVTWQPTDMADCLGSINAYRDEAQLPNLLAPLGVNLFDSDWPVTQANVVVCINTIHIVAWSAVQNLFANAERILSSGGVLYVYGPYRYQHRPLEPSNVQFDQWLKERDPVSGVRDFEAVDELAVSRGLGLVADKPMPANNRSIWWQKSSFAD